MSGIAEDEVVEHTLTQIQECYLFRLPPRVRAQGWLAADMTTQMWAGRMRVVQRGQEAAIMLIDRRDGKLFAMCKVEDGAVERVPDSSRYFVIKIQNAQGRHAFVGLAFDDRNQAFDFNVALQEFKKDIERSQMLGAGGAGEGEVDGSAPGTTPVSTVDLSLKKGEKIKISIGGGKSSSRPRRLGTSSGSGGGLTLAPPPGDTARKGGTDGSGGRGLLAPPPGDTRRARGITAPFSNNSKSLNSPPATSAAAGSSSSTGSGAKSVTSSSGDVMPVFSAPVAISAAPVTDVPPTDVFSSDPFAVVSAGGSGVGGGGEGGGEFGTMGAGAIPGPFAGGGNGGGSGGCSCGQGGLGVGNSNAGVSAGNDSGGPQTRAPDDDPFGLGLGSESNSATSGGLAVSPQPPQQASAGSLAGWGLSDLSNLGVGLPPAQAPTAGASVVSGRGGAGVGLGFEGMPTNNDSVVDGGGGGGGGGGPLAGSGMMPMPQLAANLLDQGGGSFQSGWGHQPGGGIGQTGGASAPDSKPNDDPFGGLF